MIEKMSPCPFCGGTSIEIVYCEVGCCGAKPRFINCECGVELGGLWNFDSEAIQQWNKRADPYPIFDILPRLWDKGYTTKEQDGEWCLFRSDGEGVLTGKTFKELCVNIVLAGI